MNEKKGKVFVVATPIGNLEDITLRALRVLKEVDIIAAEDTRHSRTLLNHFSISKPLISYHQFNEARRTQEFLKYLQEGKNIALVSDAGMPSVSDPGERLIRACVENDIPVEVIPGASAVLQALVVTGFPITPFYFGGFLPIKTVGRRKEYLAAADRTCTSIYFESPHRIVRSLEDASKETPALSMCIARELTKKFEEVRRGSPQELLDHYRVAGIKGEICIVIGGSKKKKEKKEMVKKKKIGRGNKE